MPKSYETVIRKRRGLVPLEPREIWEYKDLLFFLVLRDIKVRYKQTFLGIAWVILQPLLTALLFSFIFGRLAQIPSDGIAYPLFSYSGLLIWNYFSLTITKTTDSLIANTNLITKVYFPRVLIPVGASLSGMLDFFISGIFFVGMILFFHASPSFFLIVAGPILLGMVFLIAVGCGLWLSALNVEYRDFQYIIPFFVQIWMFATPVIYPASLWPDRFRWLIYLNPMCGYIEAFRALSVGNHVVNLTSLMCSLILTVLILASGLFYFKRVERSFADVI